MRGNNPNSFWSRIPVFQSEHPVTADALATNVRTRANANAPVVVTPITTENRFVFFEEHDNDTVTDVVEGNRNVNETADNQNQTAENQNNNNEDCFLLFELEEMEGTKETRTAGWLQRLLSSNGMEPYVNPTAADARNLQEKILNILANDYNSQEEGCGWAGLSESQQ